MNQVSIVIAVAGAIVGAVVLTALTVSFGLATPALAQTASIAADADVFAYALPGYFASSA